MKGVVICHHVLLVLSTEAIFTSGCSFPAFAEESEPCVTFTLADATVVKISAMSLGKWLSSHDGFDSVMTKAISREDFVQSGKHMLAVEVVGLRTALLLCNHPDGQSFPT